VITAWFCAADWDHKQAELVADLLSNGVTYKSHGKVIDFSEAKDVLKLNPETQHALVQVQDNPEDVDDANGDRSRKGHSSRRNHTWSGDLGRREPRESASILTGSLRPWLAQ
jgi:hypothetical protein